MNHSEEVFVHRIREVKYIQIDFYSIDDMEEEPAEQLASRVNAAIKEGWNPMGTPVFAGREQEIPTLIQMMVKRS